MLSTLNYSNFHLQSPLSTSRTHDFRIWKRRRLKFHNNNKLNVSCQFTPLFDVNFISINSLELIIPALGLASGLALYLSRNKPKQYSDIYDLGEWILFTSPTPFNRFVFLRCPSIKFKGSELLEDLNEKLVKEDRHFVKLLSGRITVKEIDEKNESFEDKLVYQRICVSTSDGGVISLDWPRNLDLMEEHGMDTTVVLVPGTAKGSMDKNVRLFVCELLKRGCFPVVMNPRGCAGSPLTTARLFTAADSNDICTAIQFINKARPWNTMMAVGWGNGANMLTKYLAEVEERTPLTAATCIDNPFDLEEATRSFPYHLAVDQKLTSGLIDILRSSKELFQGRAKGFNVEKALSATSLRDFEREISMVAYGFKTIEEFYSKSSTRELVGNLKIPVLFIQSDDGTVPPFSIPRSSIAENPFTSLLLCSCLPPSTIIIEKSALRWCQDFAIEWLSAVELGLLKGRHPLLKDVDVAINPSANFSLVESRASNKNSGVDKFLNLTEMNALNGYPVDSAKDVVNRNEMTNYLYLGSQRNLSDDSKSQGGNSELMEQNSSVDASLVEESGENSGDSDRSQVLQSAQLVMNMLDVSMPGTLDEEQKKKVLHAMDQGETLMKALQGALPEDVRGKLTTSVSEIVRTKGTNLNLDRIMNISLVPNASSELKSKIQDKVKELSSSTGGFDDVPPPEPIKLGDEMSGSAQSVVEKPPVDLESDIQPSQKLQKSLDRDQSESSNNSDAPSSRSKEANELKKSRDQEEISRERAAESPGCDESGSGTDANINNHNRSEKADKFDLVIGEEERLDNDMTQTSKNELNGTQMKEETNIDVSDDDKKSRSTTETEESLSPATSSPGPQLMEEESNHSQKDGSKNIKPVDDQNEQGHTKSDEPAQSSPPASNPPSFNVSQALDALTGFDDSTQMAVNSVFGVLENMIAKLEEENGQEIDEKQDKSKDGEPSSPNEEFHIGSQSEDLPRSKENFKGDSKLESDLLQYRHPGDEHSDSVVGVHQNAHNDGDEKQLPESSSTSSEKNTGSSHGSGLTSHFDKETYRRINEVIDSKLSVQKSGLDGHISKLPLHVTVNPYGDSMYNEHLRRYLLSKIPNTKSLDLDSTTDLLLDYFPEEGQWKLLDQTGINGESDSTVGNNQNINGSGRIINSPPRDSDTNEIIETSYVVLDTEKEQQPIEEYKTADGLSKNFKEEETMVCSVKNIILDSLRVEVGRRLGLPDMKKMELNLALDLENVAEVVSLAVGDSKVLTWFSENGLASGEVVPLHGEYIAQTITSAVNDTTYLRKLLPVGVVVGSSLSALRKYFVVATQNDNGYGRDTIVDHAKNVGKKFNGQVSETGNDIKLVSMGKEHSSTDSSVKEMVKLEAEDNENVMASAVTAAFGASAFFLHQQSKDPYNRNEVADVSLRPLHENRNHLEENEKNESQSVSSLAEKAMSIAAPVVPTKGDGGVDQDRLVAMLSDLGQKGGTLRMIGKLALLWGGIRGAMSLTDRLISFLRIADRPLFQRLLGFVCMTLVLWSPVVIPLFPTLVQGWAAHNSTGIAEYACVIGLYTAVTMLIILWGKRIRGYEDSLEQYGLDLTSAGKLLDFLKGLVAGVMLVLAIHLINALLGCSHFSWSWSSSSPVSMASLKACGRLLVLAGRGIVTATIVVIVEEILFRSWLPQEIAADFGYNRAVIISGFAFSIFQRSLRSIPGLWLLSIALSGLRQRGEGSLSVPIGMRAGILSSSFVLQTGGFLIYHSKYPLWLAGANPLQPFDGAVGLAFCIILAILLYPKQLLCTKELPRGIHEE